jgi:hypothetical protein
VSTGRGGFHGRRWLLFLALALVFSNLSTSLGDSQVHGGQNNPRFEGLVFKNKAKWSSKRTK